MIEDRRHGALQAKGVSFFLGAFQERQAVFIGLTAASIFVTNLTFCAFLRLTDSKFGKREAGFRPINGHQRSIFRTL